MSSKLFDSTTDALATSIRMRQIRHNVTASNIANHETPGYKAQKVEFEEALAKSLELGGTDGGALPVTAEVYDNPEAVVSNDGNTVDMEKEMSALAENSILYKSALQLINKKMAALKYAIGGGN
ncbi:MAG: flagellar basal body rod protein FlgB [Pseudobdellovibrio sp.]|nr:flagellar basal body rod protein FlgB [Pseudobdellovibrio sp.]